MCLYPRLILNPKYIGNKKNKFTPPELKDVRKKYISIGCGKCIECLNKKRRDWIIRLTEENKQNNTYFCTLTFNDESLEKLIEYNDGDTDANEIAKSAIRLFTERYRKKYKKALKHWFITELGKKEKRIHLHGFCWTDVNEKELDKFWGYGYTLFKRANSEKAIKYCLKYVTKNEENHEPKILASKGIGKSYIKSPAGILNKYNGKTTREYYILNGKKKQLPVYYRNLLYSDEEKENLWGFKLDKKIRWIDGEKIDISTTEGLKNFYNKLKAAQDKYEKLGFKIDQEWNKKIYRQTNNKLNKK